MGSDVASRVGHAVGVCGVPAGAMLLGGLVSRLGTPPEKAVHALQHLGAGIVLGAVSTEVLPLLLTQAGGGGGMGVNDFTAVACAGFLGGLVLMLVVRSLTQHASEAPEVPSEAWIPLLGPEEGEGGEPAEAAEEEEEEEGWDAEVAAVHDSASPRASGPERVRETFVRGRASTFGRHAAWSAYSEAHADVWDRDVSWGAPFPWTFTIAVLVDSLMDGALVGMTLTTTRPTVGWAIALAMAVEMGFLGLTYAVACSRQSLPTQMACVAGMPLAILAGGAAGARGTEVAVQGHLAAFVAALSFGVATLLYLCCEELLLESHACGRGHTWWVDMSFFVGFLGMFITSVREGEAVPH